MWNMLHHLFCPVHGIVVAAIVAMPLAAAAVRLAIYKLKH
jgi:hypothetical protein